MSANGRAEPSVADGEGQLVTFVLSAKEGKSAKALAEWCVRWTDAGPQQISLGCQGQPALTLSLSSEDAKLVAAGRLAPCVAYMQGRLKTVGDNALLLRVLRWTATAAFEQALARWSAMPALKPENLLAC